ncbi:MAG: aminotransferase class I/II-fold pyridoxal phosphate-dependent enzyme [Peptococcaceae bacterium]|nr:aminotransferase class I/II-fold pyridoxal phosphate-dependent enzyme [Peptococcaceae bacterium]
MTYDFTTLMDRRGQDAMALDALGKLPIVPGAPKEGFDAIPMWVADMNFPVCPSITEALAARITHPAYGYFLPRDEYFSSIIDWHAKRNGVSGLTRDAIGYENGVLGGVASALGVLCSRGDNVLVHAPTYIGFTGTLENNGYHIVHSPLVQDENGIWRMDYADMEEKIRSEKIHAAILCSPHNPTGRVWERWELEQAMALFAKYDVAVISDEIWSDIILPGHKHIPTQSVSDDARQRTVALYAPSKTFNLAGLIGSYHIIYNPWLRDRIEKQSSLCHYNEMNVLSMHALIGAYREEGHVWVDELRQVLGANVDFAYNTICEHFQGVQLAKPQGTYMLFLNCTDWCAAHGKTLDELLHACWDVGVAVQDGRPFHGACHIRMNLALPKSRVEEAFARLNRYVFNA